MSAHSQLLLDEQPLFVLPSLAVVFGVETALFLQQLHYWLQISGKKRDGRLWIYNTFEEWQKQFPFMSLTSLKRIKQKLVKSGLIITSNYNSNTYDRTLWYTIDYIKLDQTSIVSKRTMDSVKTDYGLVQNGLTIPETTTETTQDTQSHPTPLTSHSKLADEHILSPVQESAYSNLHTKKACSSGSKCLTEYTRIPLTEAELWNIANAKSVSLQSVRQIHDQVLMSIDEGNPYHAKTVKLTLLKWLSMKMGEGKIDTLTNEALMVLQWQNPDRNILEKLKQYE